MSHGFNIILIFLFLIIAASASSRVVLRWNPELYSNLENKLVPRAAWPCRHLNLLIHQYQLKELQVLNFCYT